MMSGVSVHPPGMGAPYLLPVVLGLNHSVPSPHPKPLSFSATSLTGFLPSGMQAQLGVAGGRVLSSMWGPRFLGLGVAVGGAHC